MSEAASGEATSRAYQPRAFRPGVQPKPPGLAELLNWIQALLGHDADRQVSLRGQEQKLRETMPALIKAETDRNTLLGKDGYIAAWLGGNLKKSP